VLLVEDVDPEAGDALHLVRHVQDPGLFEPLSLGVCHDPVHQLARVVG